MSPKTDNDYFADKVELRIEALTHCPKTANVLECFAGERRLWRAAKAKTKRQIEVVSIEKDSSRIGMDMLGDSSEVLKTIPLDSFHIVDLDAYGVPYLHLVALAERQYMGIVVITFIQSLAGILPKAMLMEIGFTEKQYKTCPCLCSKRGWEKFRLFLWQRGWISIVHRSHSRKHYLMTSMSWGKQI